MHPGCRAEAGLDLSLDGEPGLLVEAERMPVGERRLVTLATAPLLYRYGYAGAPPG